MQPVLFLSFSICKPEGTLAKENPDPIFYLYAIYSFIYWPFYIQFLNVTCEPRLISARPFFYVLFFIKVGKSYPAHVAV